MIKDLKLKVHRWIKDLKLAVNKWITDLKLQCIYMYMDYIFKTSNA